MQRIKTEYRRKQKQNCVIHSWDSLTSGCSLFASVRCHNKAEERQADGRRVSASCRRLPGEQTDRWT